ncbi:hypothetical protein FOZ62_026907 [Perkinsus olseni]|uniref:Proteinase inhibitor I42 chagasin domain-containing protein n=1 Tax=Perkinsus olseni TaxID=32597 RepID=A0A7J6U6A8_PEROL|nr:hypothetical protein FOZ62_026907 [Perkinsus olseni]
MVLPRYTLGFLLLYSLDRRGQSCLAATARPAYSNATEEIDLPEALKGRSLPRPVKGIQRHQLAPGSVVDLMVDVGEVIEISLVGNPTTGYSWQDADRRRRRAAAAAAGGRSSELAADPEAPHRSQGGQETLSKNGLEGPPADVAWHAPPVTGAGHYILALQVNPHPLGYVGTGGIYYFYYQALRPGSCQLRFAYTRPWEHVPIPEEHYARANVRVHSTTAAAADDGGGGGREKAERVELPEDSSGHQMYVMS